MEDRNVKEELITRLGGVDTAESKLIQQRLLSEDLQRILDTKEDELTIGEKLMWKMVKGLMAEDHELTTKEMLDLKKILGQDIQKSQRVEAHVKVDAREGSSTEKFLKGLKNDG